VPSNLIPIVALTQSIENELARIRLICLYRHCNALHFGNKLTYYKSSCQNVDFTYCWLLLLLYKGCWSKIWCDFIMVAFIISIKLF